MDDRFGTHRHPSRVPPRRLTCTDGVFGTYTLDQAAPLRALPHPDTTDNKIIWGDRLGGAIHEYMQAA
jgi:hypothetical protein